MKALLILPFTLLAAIFGQFKWVSPNWIKTSFSIKQHSPLLFWTIVTLITILALTAVYYLAQPSPITVTTHIHTPSISNKEQTQPKPSPLLIDFIYDQSTIPANKKAPSSGPSVARIDLINSTINSGIKLSPHLAGRWTWLTDRQLQFTPDHAWPAGQEYNVHFSKNIFTSRALLSKYNYSFNTHKLKSKITGIEFYQDPQKSSSRHVVATVEFNYPIDTTSFEKHIAMTLRPSDSTINVKAKHYPFTVSYSKNLREAYLKSETIRLPKHSNFMSVQVSSGIKSRLGGQASSQDYQQKVLIPDANSFLKVETLSTQIVRNTDNDPQQVLSISFTDELSQSEIEQTLSAYLLPERPFWKSPREINANVLLNSTPVKLTVIPNERDNSKQYNFIFDAPQNRQLYIKLKSGFKSVNNFVHPSFYDELVRSPSYPKEISIAGDGSVLTNSGQHTLRVVSRGIPAIKYRIGKLLDNQIYHLVSQSNGDISHPNFSNWRFDENNVAKFDSKIVNLSNNNPKTANYSSLDLSQYSQQKTTDSEREFGLFFVDAMGWDNTRNQAIYGAHESKIILVTDLGLIVKNNADGSHDMFVQSIHTGLPVANATVELLGKNGVALVSKTTSKYGHVKLPSTRDFSHEQKPTVYVVKTHNDISFIPYNRSSRQINLSRFDIGGVESHQHTKHSLNAYLFSDRGIYRPGETVNIGLIVKRSDLSHVEGIPLEVVIRGPRQNEVKVSRITLSESGFMEYLFPTDLTSDTGQYSISIHLVRDKKWRGQTLGSSQFTVEEFQPDTLKIRSQLLNVAPLGWTTAKALQAEVTLTNLFGLPAQNRKVTANMTIKPAHFAFKRYQNYHFTDPYYDPTKKPLSLNESLAAQTTNDQGHSNFDLDLSRFRSGTYQLSLITEGFDQAGGRSVTAINHALISPLERLIGYKADGALDYINANSERTLSLITIDPALNQIAHEQLTAKIVEIEAVSTLVKQRDGQYRYQTVNKERLISEQPLSISSSGSEYQIDTTSPGDFALEIYDHTQLKLVRIPYSVVGFGNLTGKIDKQAELNIKLNKSDYLPGEDIEVSIKAPYAGAGLITIESDHVHQFKWFKTSEESTLQSIKLPNDIEGSAYINVSFIRDINSKDIFTSPLSYAVKPFSIDKSQRTLNIGLDIAEVVRPGKTMEIGFTSSQPAKMVLFAIDEGILQVANYTTPDPVGHFLKKRALSVQTLQILDLVLPEFNLIKTLSASGGGANLRSDALAKNLNPFQRKQDAPAIYWSGIVDADQNTNTVQFDVPNTFAGSLVVMAVAVNDHAMGVAQSSAVVKGPFIISPNVLTHVAPGDEFDVTVGVANNITDSGTGAKITVEAHSSEQLEIIGPSQHIIAIDENSEGQAKFRVKAKQQLGAAQITFSASLEDEYFERSTGLSVRPATPYFSQFVSGYTQHASTTLHPQRQLYSSLSEHYISASTSPLVIVDGLTDYLAHYPHGCTEQIISQVFPLIGLNALAEYSPHINDVKQPFNHVISQLTRRQQANGGFAFWPGQTRSSVYPSIYAMHFLIEAQSLGYPVPTAMVQRGKAFLTTLAQTRAKSFNDARNKAIALYLLTRMGEVTTNYLVDLEEYLSKHHAKQWRHDISAIYIASTYQLLKKQDEAEALIKHFKAEHTPNDDSSGFNSTLAHNAQYIFLLSKHFEDHARQQPTKRILQLTDSIFKGEYNTHSAAYSVLALGAYSQLSDMALYDSAIEFVISEHNKTPYVATPEATPFLGVDYPISTSALTLNSEQPVYYLNNQSGFDKHLPKLPLSEGIEIYRDFLNQDGEVITEYEQGQQLTVRLRVRALTEKPLNNVAVIDLLPGGFEILTSPVNRANLSWQADYVDIREDRIVYYGSFDSSITELSYDIKVTASGQFTIPPSYAESMYNRTIRAFSSQSTVNISPSP